MVPAQNSCFPQEPIPAWDGWLHQVENTVCLFVFWFSGLDVNDE